MENQQELKSKAYDLIAQIGLHQHHIEKLRQELGAVEQKIIKLMADEQKSKQIEIESD